MAPLTWGLVKRAVRTFSAYSVQHGDMQRRKLIGGAGKRAGIESILAAYGGGGGAGRSIKLNMPSRGVPHTDTGVNAQG